VEALWRHDGVFPIEEGATGSSVPVHYQFLAELKQYASNPVRVEVATLIVHGLRDEKVPHQHSVEFVATNKSAQLRKQHSLV
jgi:hypothetical protein